MHKHISERFIECLEVLKKENKIRSSRQFSISIDVHPQCISDVVTGKRDVSSVMIQKCVDHYKFNPLYLYTGKGEKFIIENETSELTSDPVLTIVTDNIGNERIIHVPVSAQAGYGQELYNPVFVKDLPSFTLPGENFSHGSYRCFDVVGDSMEPTLFSGDKVVCSFVEPENYYNNLRNNYVYVIITQSGVVVKRVHSELKREAYLILNSDNSYYDPFQVELAEIKEMWKVTHKISVFMPSPSHIRNALHAEVGGLKDTISDQSKMIKSLNSTVEKLLKQNRSSYLGV